MFKVVARRGRLLSVALSAAIALSPAVAMARGAHAHSGHGHHSQKSDKDTNTNSNGKNSTDHEKGHARAEDRMNQNGLDHNNAGITDTDDTSSSNGG